MARQRKRLAPGNQDRFRLRAWPSRFWIEMQVNDTEQIDLWDDTMCDAFGPRRHAANAAILLQELGATDVNVLAPGCVTAVRGEIHLLLGKHRGPRCARGR